MLHRFAVSVTTFAKLQVLSVFEVICSFLSIFSSFLIVPISITAGDCCVLMVDK